METLLLDLGFDFCSENEGTRALVSLHGALAVDCPCFALGSSVQGPRQTCSQLSSGWRHTGSKHM